MKHSVHIPLSVDVEQSQSCLVGVEAVEWKLVCARDGLCFYFHFRLFSFSLVVARLRLISHDVGSLFFLNAFWLIRLSVEIDSFWHASESSTPSTGLCVWYGVYFYHQSRAHSRCVFEESRMWYIYFMGARHFNFGKHEDEFTLRLSNCLTRTLSVGRNINML